ncbi:hypothetical protein TNCT_222181 [Trichonephila clavata]|uniref:Uncharacterized protein n=1 Tax=Trichonephila clavata TaxID=2740835 RepID=A0A8X6JNA7_TRICU|nr:hypothetical protein TNCT_222181 [Trichonephila clavata]
MGTKFDPEDHSFTVKLDNIQIEGSEIRASDASKEARTVRLEEMTSENAFFEVENGLMFAAGRLKKC